MTTKKNELTRERPTEMTRRRQLWSFVLEKLIVSISFFIYCYHYFILFLSAFVVYGAHLILFLLFYSYHHTIVLFCFLVLLVYTVLVTA